MKYFVTWCLLAVILFTGVTALATSSNERVLPHTETAPKDKSRPDHHQFAFSQNDLFLGVEMRTEQSRLPHLFQHLTYRTLPSLLNAFRIHHSDELNYQKFITGCNRLALKSAFKQLDGYYLYYLRKMLI